jgi:signal transduction histidine kinase
VAKPATISLRVLSGELQGQVIRVDGDLVVGRSTTCQVFVPDRRISREHARFSLDEGRLYIEDLGSHNGTFVNGQRVGRCELFRGDLVRLGSSQIAVDIPVGAHESSSVQVVNEADGVQPFLVRPVDSITSQSLTELVQRNWLDQLGAGDSAALAGNQNVQEILARTRQFAILYEVSQALQQTSDLRADLPSLLDLILQVVRGDRVALLRFDANNELQVHTVRFADKTLNDVAVPSLAISKTVADAVLTQRCAIVTADTSTDQRFAASESIVLNNVRSLLAVPVLVGNRLLGLIEVENTRSINGFDEADLRLVTIVGSMLGVALDNYEATLAREQAIADLQAAQAKLIATQERLVVSERMGVLGRLSSGIAHEVKNHLSPFMLADMIAHKYPDDEEIQETAQLMLEAQQRILGLVDEIRSFAAGNQSAVNIAPHEMAQLIASVLRFMRCDRVVKAADIRFEPTEQVLVFMDAHRIRQVLINLIRNAADALPERNGRIDIRTFRHEGKVVVEVRDNGRGIAPEVADRVFEPFFSTKGDKGLGLGLDISRQIAIAHGGSLGFVSTPGGGTTFRLELPLQPADFELPVDAQPDTDPNAHNVLEAWAQAAEPTRV